MRIISGFHKGRRIKAPKKLPVRPTTDMAKEALFNILNNKYYFDELSVLDLFAGTGSISYEFASRGAENIIAIDQAQGCVNFIKKTTAELDMPINVFKSNAFTYLENLTLQFDIIFADPPYNFSDDQFARISELVFERSLLANEGLLVIEHSKHTVLSNLDFYRYSKSYGGNVFSFFTLE